MGFEFFGVLLQLIGKARNTSTTSDVTFLNRLLADLKTFRKKHLQKFKKFTKNLLHCCAFGDILLHISEDVELCS